jgi:tetratricopeptide (TPR) repeat protein
MRMDEPLASVVAGKWDAAEAAGKRLAAKAEERKSTAARTKVYTPYRAKDYRATLSAIEEVTSSEPKLAQQFATLKLNCLCMVGDIDAAVAMGETLLKSQHDNAQALNGTFFPLVDLAAKTAPDPRIVKLALQAARRANELTNGRNPMILDTLAVALYRNGEVAEAAAMQEKAVEQVEAQTANKSAPMIKDYRGRLERFRKEATEKGGKADKP